MNSLSRHFPAFCAVSSSAGRGLVRWGRRIKSHPDYRPAVALIGLEAFLLSNVVFPFSMVAAAPRLANQSQHPGLRLAQNDEAPDQNAAIHLGEEGTEKIQLGEHTSVTKIGAARRPFKLKPSADLGCGPAGNCRVTVRPLDLSHVPSEKELRMAGQMGGALAPLFPADIEVWQAKFSQQLKEAGVEGGLNAAALPTSPAGQLIMAKRQQLDRLRKMNLNFGKAMQDWNKHNYRVAATQFESYLKDYPDSPWAGEAALHLGCDAKYNGRFNEAQDRFQEIINNTSADPADPSWEIHEKAKLRWSDLDITLGRFQGATDKLANLLQTEKDWRRKTWERTWFHQVGVDKRDARVLRACGARALGQVLVSLGRQDQADKVIRMTPKREAGFSLRDLSGMAQHAGLPMQGFKLDPDHLDLKALAAVPLPFIIHYDFGDAKHQGPAAHQTTFWPLNSKDVPAAGTFLARARQGIANPTKTAIRLRKQEAVFHSAEQAGHFLVVNNFDKAAGKVYIFDPQEGRHYILTVGQLEREWSGAGLMLASRPGSRVGKNEATGLPRLALLSPEEMRQYVGGCCGVAAPGGPGGPGNPNNKPCGSPVWSVDPVNLNLNFYDIPLWYRTPVGPDVQLTMSYNSKDALNQNITMGNKWSFGYGSYLVEDTTTGGGNIVVFSPTGVEDVYIPVPGTNQYTSKHPENQNTLIRVDAHRFELTLLDGTVYVYDLPAGTDSMQSILVQERDRYGYALTFGYDSKVELTTITDAQGKVTQLFYDSDQHLTRARTPFGREASFTYDKNGNMVQVVDIEGNAFGYVYDSEVRVTEMDTVQGPWLFKHEGPDGNSAGQYLYPPPDAPTWESARLTITNPLGQKEEYFYSAGDVAGGYMYPGDTGFINGWKFFHVSPRYYTPYQSATVNNMALSVPKTLWETNQTVADYGKVTKVTLPSTDGLTYTSLTTDYDSISGQPIQTGKRVDRIDPYYGARGGDQDLVYKKTTSTTTYNSRRQVTSVTDEKGRTSRIEYAYNNLDPVRIIDDHGRVQAEFGYVDISQNHMGIVKDVSVPSQVEGQPARNIHLTFQSWGVPASVDDGESVTNYQYDADGRLQFVKRGDVSLATIGYDGQNRIKSVTDSSGQTAIYSFDELDHVNKVTYPDGTSSETQSVCCGMPGLTRDRAGRIIYHDYDALKRPIRVQDSAGNTVQTDYDADGNLTQLLDAKGNETRFQYDSRRRLTGKRYADNTAEIWTYDDRDRLATSRDGRGRITHYFYDNDDKLIKVDYPTMPDVTIDYDSEDRPSRVVDGIGETKFSYDSMDRLTKVDGPWDSDTVEYGYDSQSRQTELKLPAVTGSSVPDAGYDDLFYSYDDVGRVDHAQGQAGLFQYSYAGYSGKLTQLAMPNNCKMNFAYDSLDRLESVENVKGTEDLISRYTYGYEGTNSTGNYQNRGVATYVQSQLGDGTPQRRDFGYSDVDRLTNEIVNNVTETGDVPVISRSFGYDAMGNRNSAAVTDPVGSASFTQTASHNSLNQLTSAVLTPGTGNAVTTQISYDADGNTSQISSSETTLDGPQSHGRTTCTFDDADRLTQWVAYNASSVPLHKSNYVYDAADRRRIDCEYDWVDGAWSKVSERRFVYDGMEVVQERDENNKVVAVNTWAGGNGGLLSRATADGRFYYQYDGHDNVVAMTDATQNVVAQYAYDAFGNITYQSGSQASSNPYRFATKRINTWSGLYDFGVRAYSPSLGRFVNRDPSSEAGGLNLYNFAGGDPVNQTDAYGLSIKSFFVGFIEGLGMGIFAGYVTAAAMGIVSVSFPEIAAILTDIGYVILGPAIFKVLQELWDIWHSDLCDDDKHFKIGQIVGGVIGMILGGLATRIRTTGCFAAGTPVSMADGSTKPIESIRPGDEVLSKDEISGRTVKGKVKSSWSHAAVKTVTLAFSDGSKVEATEDHPFYTAKDGWKPAGEIGLGTSIQTRAGPWVEVTSVEVKYKGEAVYNFEVEGTHSYFVGASGVWVHNQAGGQCGGTFRNGWRSPNGKFATPQGPGRAGEEAVKQVTAELDADPNWQVLGHEVHMEGSERIYDIVAKDLRTNENVGFEVKSGTAPYSGSQKAYDTNVNLPGNSAQPIGQYSHLGPVTRVEFRRVP